MKNKKKYGLGGNMNPNEKQGLASVLGMTSAIAPMFGPIGMGVGLAAGMGASALNNSAEKQMKGPHLSSFAGYADGGPIDPPNHQYIEWHGRKVKFDSNKAVPLTMAGKHVYNQFAVQDMDQGIWFDVERDQNGSYIMKGSGGRMTVDNILDKRIGGSGESSKTKSKDRFREMASGGFMDINSNSFEVNGDPNQKDSEYYAPKDVYLDDKEIVKNNFVFSNRIKNPMTGRTFAEEAGKIEKATAKAEKRNLNSIDPISLKTIERNNMQTDKLAKMQESIAHVMGLRDSSTTGMATGGPFDPLPGQQFIATKNGGTEVYYDPYNKRLLKKNPSGSYYPLNGGDPALYMPTEEQIVNHLQQYPGTQSTQTPVVKSPVQEIDSRGFDPTTGSSLQYIAPENNGTVSSYRPSVGDRYYNNQGNTSDSFISLGDGKYKDPKTGMILHRMPNGSYAIPQGQKQTSGIPFVPPIDDGLEDTPVLNPENIKPNKSSGVKSLPTKKIQPVPTKSSGTDWRAIDDSNYTPDPGPAYPLEPIPYMKSDIPMRNDGLAPVTSQTPVSLDLNQYKVPVAAAAAEEAVTSNTKNLGFTTGDYMQMAAALYRLNNFQRPEVETPNLDLTEITKQSYDVNPVLAQNNRNYQNAVNNTSASSPNLRRAITNQMYAQKLNQDSNTLNQYQQMNNQGQVSYEDRSSNQRRYNAGQTSYTQDLNARNRGASANARQAAFDQLGTVGMMLNEKKQSQAYINALKVRYPDISESVLNDILGR